MRASLSLLLAFSGFSATAAAGTIYIGDYGQIYKLSSGGTASSFASGTGTTNLGMAFDSTGDLFVNSRDNNAIYKITPSGVVSTFASISNPYGLAVDAAGDVFTSSPSSDSIVEYSPTGVASTFATDPGGYAYSLAIDPVTGNLFEGDYNENIYEYTPSGTRTTFATGLPGITLGIAFDQQGDIFAANWGGQILKFTPSGTESVFATFSTQTLPTGLAYDYATNQLYMTEVANGISNYAQQVVDVFTAAGVQSTFTTGLYVPYAIADLQTQSSPATPEPGTFSLFAGVGLLALGRLRRR